MTSQFQAREEQQAAEKTAAAALLRAAAQFEDNQWCQQATAVDQFGENVDPAGDAAVQRCLLGHLERAAHQAGQGPLQLQGIAFQAVQGEVDFPQSVADWNDAPGRTPEQVRRLLRKAAHALVEEAREIQDQLYVRRSDQAAERELALAGRS